LLDNNSRLWATGQSTGLVLTIGNGGWREQELHSESVSRW
jgi:hypothetical protein